MTEQLPLNIRLDRHATFDNFYVIEENKFLISQLQLMLQQPSPYSFIYLWGPTGSGRSHLLQALAQHTHDAIYLPSKDIIHCDAAEVLAVLDTHSMLLIDDLPLFCGNRHWEENIFHLFNKLHHAGQKLVVTADVPPKELDIQLADLKSRLASGLTLYIQPLSDVGKHAALQFRANLRGFTLSDEVVEFLLQHESRHMHHLIDILNALDHNSLAKKHKLTIPFIRKILLQTRRPDII